MPEENKISPEQLAEIEVLKKAYTTCFSGKSGQRVLEDLERKCFIHTPTIHKDATIMAGREGMRDAILHIKTMIKFDLDKIKKIAQQQESEEKDNV